MKLAQLLEDDNAVSPVIGVILMVAITVILAAVIGTFVLGLGDQMQQTAPQAAFTFSTNSLDSGDNVTITHDGGDTIEAGNLQIAGDINPSSPSAWTTMTTSGDTGATDSVSAGDTASIEASSSSGTVRIVWKSGDSSATLSKLEYE